MLHTLRLETFATARRVRARQLTFIRHAFLRARVITCTITMFTATIIAVHAYGGCREVNLKTRDESAPYHRHRAMRHEAWNTGGPYTRLCHLPPQTEIKAIRAKVHTASAAYDISLADQSVLHDDA